MNLKIKDTVSKEDRLAVLYSKPKIGIFNNMFADDFHGLLTSLCAGYYWLRSANKTVSPFFCELIEQSEETGGTKDEALSIANNFIGNYLREKFGDKWERIYTALVSTNYELLESFGFTEHKGGNNSDITTYNLTDIKTGNNKDSTNYNTSTEDNGKVGTKEVTTKSVESNSDIYGFNSVSPVGDSANSENEKNTIVASPEDNTTHNLQTKTGTDTRDSIVNETGTRTGTDSKSFTIDENSTKTGRTKTGAELIQSELTLRDQNILFDIIYKDIDSVVALKIYL